jgi:Lrp/AsnC family leucine-responsive transcriptional regulator
VITWLRQLVPRLFGNSRHSESPPWQQSWTDILQRKVAFYRTLEEEQKCYLVSGNFDYLIKARVADMHAYSEFLGNTLLTLPGVQESTSYVLMEQLRETLTLRVPP